jgi:phosphohistidine phosphatase SixA
VRTQETLKGLLRVWAQHCDGPLPEILYFDALYLASPDTILGHLQEHAGERQKLMTIGHNPGIEQLASELLGIPLEMKTAHLVIVQQDGNTRWSLRENFRGED